MRNVQLLINQIRRQTENVEFTQNTGIQNDEILQYLNDGQVDMQAAISLQHPQVFQQEKVIDIVPNQEAYAIPDDAFLGNRVDLVEYSHTGNARDYWGLKAGRLPERINGQVFTTPSFYIRRSGALLLQPPPIETNGKIRVTYQKTIPTLDIQRGLVGSVTLATDTITALTLDTTVEIDAQALEEEGYITVVDKDGVVKMRRIPVLDVDQNTGVVTIDPSFTFQSGETIAVGDVVLRGREATTHSQLSDICERYLLQYGVWKVLKRDSSTDSPEASMELSALKDSIVASFAEPDGDVQYVPILDDKFLTHDGYY